MLRSPAIALTLVCVTAGLVSLWTPSTSQAESSRDEAGSNTSLRFAELDLDNPSGGMPTIEDFGYYLSNLSEKDKADALNIVADLSSDGHLDPAMVAGALRRLLTEGSPPTRLGYCKGCFKRQLSDVLDPLRLRGPRVDAPEEGIVVLRVNESFLKRLRPQALDEVGGTIPGLVQALLDGWSIAGKFERGSYVRFHNKYGDVQLEPMFFSSSDALQRYEVKLDSSLDDWTLSRWLCQPMPRNRFEPGLLVLYFNPSDVLKEVRIPTAADSEDPSFRPSPLGEPDHGQTCGGAPLWASENIPLSAFTRARFIPNTRYFE